MSSRDAIPTGSRAPLCRWRSVFCAGETPRGSPFSSTPQLIHLLIRFSVSGGVGWRRRRAVWVLLTRFLIRAARKGMSQVQAPPRQDPGGLALIFWGDGGDPSPPRPLWDRGGLCLSPPLQPGGQKAPCRGASHVDFTEKAAMHISLLIYWFLTRSLCRLKKPSCTLQGSADWGRK